jgi:hypothetical protein
MVVELELFIATSTASINLQQYALANALGRPLYMSSNPESALRCGSGLFGLHGLFCPTRKEAEECHKQPLVVGWADDTYTSLVPALRPECEVQDTESMRDVAFASAMETAASSLKGKFETRFQPEVELHVMIVKATALDCEGTFCT